jgi:hypothetical protein
MPHQHTDIDDYHEGDSRDINVTVYEQTVGGRRQSLSEARIEWLAKDQQTDADSDALLHKSSDGSAPDDNDTDGDIVITDERNGQAVIHVEEGDTDGFLTADDGTELEERTVHHRARVWDARNNRVTVLDGDWHIYK